MSFCMATKRYVVLLENGNLTYTVYRAHVFTILSLHVCRAVNLFLIVERAKKCVDFTVTFYFFHILICFLYSQVKMRFILINLCTHATTRDLHCVDRITQHFCLNPCDSLLLLKCDRRLLIKTRFGCC